jgi:hypothetical protein
MFGMIQRLQNYGGFWFPAVKLSIDRLFRTLSLGYRLNDYLDKKSLGGAWVSEVYGLLGPVIGLLWIGLIEWPVLTGTVWIVIGLLVVFYRVLEILLFTIHWLFVAEGPVKSYRRSLLGFIINLCEIGIFFTIAYLLLGCFVPPKSASSALYENLGSAFSLERVSGLRQANWIHVIAWFQLAICWVLVVLIVANVVGAIGRGEKPRMEERRQNTTTTLKALKAVDYEEKMFWTTAHCLDGQLKGDEMYPEPVVNALIESFAVHSRVLIEFLYPSKKVHPDTILARHFFSPNERWSRLCPKESSLLKDARKLANNHLAHLTYTRSKGKLDKRWPFANIAKELGAAIKIFNESAEIQALRQIARS